MTKAQERNEIYKMYDGHCAYCGCNIKENNFEVDHLEPLCRNDNYGGLDVIENKKPSCRPCNRAKGIYKIEVWRTVIANKMTELPRDVAAYRMAYRFGLVLETKMPVTFYYESENL